MKTETSKANPRQRRGARTATAASAGNATTTASARNAVSAVPVALTLAMALTVAGCTRETAETPTVDPAFNAEMAELLEDSTVFTASFVWNGYSDGFVEQGALVVREGRILSVFSTATQPLPESGVDVVDLGDVYVTPGIINAHGHVGMADGLATGPAVYSEDLVHRQLATYAHYGVTSVVSLGDEPPEAFAVRDAMRDYAPGNARLWVAGDVLDPESVAQARQQVAIAAETNPDWVKIRVDSQLGRQTPMPAPVYRQVIERSHDYELPLASHMVTLDHSKGLLQAGTDLLAHSVRDAEVDDELIELMLARDICITPTLTREVSTFVYAERPDFFDDPWFRQTVADDVIEQLQDPQVQASYRTEDAAYYRQALPLAEQNMIRLHEAGVRIAMGTDSGPPARFQGYFEHLEMQMMEDAGMSPMEVMRSATSVAAACMGLGDTIGRLDVGYWADFVTFSENPLASMDNLRSLEQVFIAGERFESPFTAN